MTLDQLAAACRRYTTAHSKDKEPNSIVWVMLDDMNVEKTLLLDFRKEAIAANDADGVSLCDEFLSISYHQRLKVCRMIDIL